MTRQKRSEPSVGFPSARMQDSVKGSSGPGRARAAAEAATSRSKQRRGGCLKPQLLKDSPHKQRHNTILARFQTGQLGVSCSPHLTHFRRRDSQKNSSVGKMDLVVGSLLRMWEVWGFILLILLTTSLTDTEFPAFILTNDVDIKPTPFVSRAFRPSIVPHLLWFASQPHIECCDCGEAN